MLKKRKTRTWSGKVFLMAILLMYIQATTHIGVCLYRLIQAYVWLRDSVGPDSYFFDTRRWDHFAHNFLICSMTWSGDALVIYRCFIIWNQRYIIILFPSLLLVYVMAVNCSVLYWFTHPHVIPFLNLIVWMDAVYPVAFFQNILTTGLIVFKILHQHYISTAAGVRSAGSRLKLIHIVRILVESAVIYTTQLFITIILYFQRHNALYIMQYAMVPTIGIVFNLIAVRIHIAELSATQTMSSGIPTGLSWWTDHHLGTTLELNRLPSHRMDVEVLPMQLKLNRPRFQGDRMGCHSGHSRSM
ncbi:hypothetical protein BDZ94DRAFT_342384 [Collybia nuda]|uniref:Uncharacterized protein n=1 Tax=Collybia nuda TaxID=64659 RepID=A0A9P6CGM2_9AGAR|nr:hypothetical protein BDZ94DRAFT_342384 [Collybia nuda]